MGIGNTYNYSVSKANGRFYGTVTAPGGTAIGKIDGIKTLRGVKSFAKAVAEQHKRESQAPASHGESHSAYGTFEL